MLPFLAAVAASAVAAAGTTAYEAEIAAAVVSVKEVHAVPPALVKAIITAESGWNPRAVSRSGALGLMQVMPGTAAKTGVRREELFIPERNILAGTRLLAVLLRHYDGDLVSALVAYNAGARQPLAPVPQNGETPAYVWRVLRYLEHFAGAGRSPTSASP